MIYLSLFISALLTETSLGTLFISASFILFSFVFYAGLKACFFGDVYVIKTEPCLSATALHLMDGPQGNPNFMLTGGKVYHLLMFHLI